MNPRGEAEGGDNKRPAHPAEADRNVGTGATGASNASSGESHCAGPGEGLIERMIESGNMNVAWKQVKGNKGAAGVDGLDIEQSAERIRRDWDQIKAQLLTGIYRPQPARRVEIPKANGGIRKLGVPTVQDRLIQQAALQVLSPLFEPDFSSHSYGFRPGRSAHQAVLAAQSYQEAGKRWVVEMDLASFFDEVNHDLLMARVRRKVKDLRMIKLIRSFLNAGVMIGGLAQTTDKGTPQGGPLSPLLSNIMLADLDKELEKRGHSFCRYADDCNIYVGSQQGGARVMDSITRFLERKLKVNRDKSAVDRPWARVFLGYSFTGHKEPKIRVAEKTCRKRREKLKERFRAGQGRNVARFIRETLNPLLRGWMNSFRLSQTKGFAEALDGWVRRRLRGIIWRQWKRPTTRFRRLCALGLDVDHARKGASNGRGGWFNSGASHMNTAYPKLTFDALGLLRLSDLHRSLASQPLRNRRDT